MAQASTSSGVATLLDSPRVLSIQSHVVSGYVGNKCATLPLQLLGFDVDPIMSVQFSNHTGYPTIRGKAFDGDHLNELLEGLKANGLVQHTHLLTGYIGTLSLLEAIANVARTLHATNPDLTYVCDPVLGDEGRCYVSQDLIGAYRSTILPLASILTPNQFEAELLTGQSITDEASALAACDALHDMGPHTVIITSMETSSSGSGGGGSGETPAEGSLPGDVQGDGGEAAGRQQTQRHLPGQFITLVASTRQQQLKGRPSAFRVHIPKLDAYFTGTGDLLCALLLAWCARLPADLATAVEKAVAGLQGVLSHTASAVADEERQLAEAAAKAQVGGASGGAAAEASGAGGGERLLSSREKTAAVFRAKELRLVQAQGLLLDPVVELRAEPLERRSGPRGAH